MSKPLTIIGVTSNGMKGFTLIETLVAVAILMITIGSAFGLAPQGLIGARFAKNQTTATYLAQEAIEVVRIIRDNSMLFSPNQNDPMNWLGSLNECVDTWCTLNAIEPRLYPCTDSPICPPLLVIESNEGVTYGNGDIFSLDPSVKSTIFTRQVLVTRISNNKIGRDDTEVLVTAKVIWKEGLVSKTTEVQTTMFDWWTSNK